MDINTTTTAHNAPPLSKSPERDTQTPPRKTISSTNGVLKRHFIHHAPPNPVVYKECLKNHAASTGGHALDGCGEFLPASTATAVDPTSLKCAVCGCHRNFHHREPDEFPAAFPMIEYHAPHRHHPLPPLTTTHPTARESHSPPPISSSYMLLSLGGGGGSGNPNQSLRKRFRSKFRQDQKDKMLELAEKMGWKMQKNHEEMVNSICREIGVERGVFKVWMHNNKNTKRSAIDVSGDRNGNMKVEDESNNGGINHNQHLNYNGKINNNQSNHPANASSSSS